VFAAASSRALTDSDSGIRRPSGNRFPYTGKLDALLSQSVGAAKVV
jgi:hypothetical protein